MISEIPGRPENVELAEHSPTTVTLKVYPPTFDGGMPVYGYRVEYEAQRQDYKRGNSCRNMSGVQCFKMLRCLVGKCK